ncbi:MAG: hypothetical protein H7Y88_06755 [Phycisphaerales bacterium]|nr:hypothetical protein [Phycisphaerales bacterium]
MGVGRTKKTDVSNEAAQAKLGAGHHHEAYRVAAQIAEKAFTELDYGAMPAPLRIMQQARAAIREKAVASGHVYLISGDIPVSPSGVKPGCYLVQPPRVGVDGRAIREMADENHVPALVIVREPTTRDGAWPVVTIGPATIRTRIEPPDAAEPSGKAKGKAKPDPSTVPDAGGAQALPSPQWFVEAAHSLAQTGIEQAKPEGSTAARVEALYLRTQAHPDGDALFAALIEACVQAAKEPKAAVRPRKPVFDEEDEDLGELG